jgi:hypothetical protein
MTDIVNVVIVLNTHTRAPRTVFGYEVPVLQAIFGVDNVVETERRAAGDGDDVPSMDDAFARLNARYESKEGQSAIQSAYHSMSEFERVYEGSSDAPVPQKRKRAN